MNEPDFSGIDPLRVPEARRRVIAIEEYLKMTSPTSADTERFAKTVGLSRVQFGRLARVWRDHRDARLLVIGKRGAASRDYGIDGRATEIAMRVIREAGASATLAGVAPEIERLCSKAGVSPPSRGTINNWIRAERTGADMPMVGPPRIVIGRMWFHLPTAGMPASAMPTLLAAVALPERIVLAHAVSTDPANPPSVPDLIDRLAAMRAVGAPPRPLLLDPDDRRVGADALDRAGLGGTRSHNRSVQRELSKAFAGRLGPLAVIHQRGMARPATKRVISRQDQPLPADQVVATIEDAINSQNAATLASPPPFDLAAR
jgi:hypothetical protein